VRPKDPEPRKQEPETADGYQVIRARTKTGEITELKVKAPRGWDVLPAPTSPDPHGGEFTLKQATAGLEGEGQLAVRIQTSMGSFYCDLFPDKAPKTVANFVGLARGKRKFWDGKEAAWVARPYYDGTEFHRVVPGFMIQGGDHTGTGKGGIGYNIPDEVHPTLRHDRPGQLCMANRGPNTGEAQFFITEAPAPHLDRSYTIFGQCSPATLVQRISRVPQSGRPRNRPLTPVKIEQVEVRRVQGGAAAWMPDSARLPPMPGLQTPGGAVQVGAEGEPAAPKQP
jgi:peptidyl-prolyl cis-trans isomerase A (cyclophilin A)